MGSLDAHIRRRLRAIQMAHWRWKRTIALRLIRLGLPRSTAWRSVYDGRKSLWALSHYPGNLGLRNAYFERRGLVSLKEKWKVLAHAAIVARAEEPCVALLG